MGVSKPLQEVMYGSGDEDATLNSNSNSYSSSNYYKNDAAFSTTSSGYSSIATNGFSAGAFSRSFVNDRTLDEDLFEDDSDEDDDDEDDYK